jgi:sarcosine oxidase subunit alpha
MQTGGLIDRDRPVSFVFDSRRMQGYEGDTLASALLANGQMLVARSFKYHRPRGIFSAGPEEASALVRVGTGSKTEPNTRATQVRLVDGLVAKSQNHWPSLSVDLLQINDYLSALFSTGFYNKTFKWPRRFWPGYEKMLRRVAGIGRASAFADDDEYQQLYRHCDVLIVGGGPTGLVAARNLVGCGARVILVDESFRLGGWLLREKSTVDGVPGQAWAQSMRDELVACDNIEVLEDTTAFGYYDHNMVALNERRPDGSQRMWRVRAGQVVLATGSIERPLVFANNDLPGVMLAGAARTYANQYGVLAGKNVVVYTNNDSALRTAIDLHEAGARFVVVADTRPALGEELMTELDARSIPVYKRATLRANGRRKLTSVTISAESLAKPGDLECDLLCVSGGWTPTLHLHAQSGGSNLYIPEFDAFVPGDSRQQSLAAGAVSGLHGLGQCLADGRRVAIEVGERLGIGLTESTVGKEAALFADAAPDAASDPEPHTIGPKQFVDLQNDVTTKDVRQAHQENYVSVEHLKRYTTLGMGTDQGKTSNLNGLSMLAKLREEPVPQVGTTTFRPPYTPVTLGVVAGKLKDRYLAPVRKTPIHHLHQQAGAVFDFNGLWLRPQCYLQAGETVDEAIRRESLAVRQRAGISDISTLGKFEIRGTDCVEFLNRVYVNNWNKLAVGRARYGVMLREDGMVLDDGTVTRLGERHYFITTSSGHAEHILQHFEHLLDVAWPELDVALVNVTEQWAGVALAGPRSREILDRAVVESEIELGALPHMGSCKAVLGKTGIPARLIRISFSGELAHEIYVPARQGADLWRMLAAGDEREAPVPYGMDAMDVLRIEKGFIVVGADADGRTTPQDVGFGRMLSTTKRFVGQHALERPALNEPGRLQLVGLRPLSPGALSEGAQLIDAPGDKGFYKSIGHVSSAGFSPTLDRYVALALVRNGRSRTGETIYSFDQARDISAPRPVQIVEPCAFDPGGERLRS